MSAQPNGKKYKIQEHQVENLIKEVYKDKADAIIFSDPIRYKVFKNLLLNRVTVYELRFKEGEDLVDLTKTPLLDAYNKNLVRNYMYNQNNFNPLKYDIALFANKTILYRIDKKHVLFVEGQKTNKK